MMDFLAFGFFCIVLNLFVLVNGRFILTGPKVLNGGSKAHLSIIVFNATEGENVTLLLKSGGDIIAESHVPVQNNHNMLVEINVPPVSVETTGLLHVLANFSDGYVINKENAVRIRPNRVLTLVQTDKPLYKPGQTIKFRVFPMDNQLRPLGSDTVGNIWIEDPSGTRVEQWKEVKFTEAIKQFELPLSEEPTLGTWKINTEINNVSSSQTFRVEKYVLPKFEVIINAPSVVWAGTNNITVEVCAKYTYGKFVKGTVSVRIEYPSQWRPIIPPVECLEEISGCYEFVMKVEDLKLPPEAFRDRGLSKPVKILTNVTERGTGIMRNAAAEIAISDYRLSVDFAGNNEYFKKTLPYYGQLQVKKPDGSPADEERVKTCAIFASKRREHESCVYLTSDKSGIVHFSIAPSSAGWIQLKASVYNLIQNSDSFTEFNPPLGKMSMKPWFSPSDRHLQIMNTSDELTCDKLQHIKILYNSKNGRKTKFYYQVLSRGRVVEHGSHRNTFESKQGNGTNYDLRDRLPQKSNIGEFVLTFETKASMSPKIRLLVFYVRKDKEIVADSKTFRIAQCLQNKVNLQFHQQKQYPGTDATLQLSASPHSLCGIKMVDKSVKLLESKEKAFILQKHIFKSLETDDVGKFHHPRMDSATYCHKKADSNEYRVPRRCYKGSWNCPECYPRPDIGETDIIYNGCPYVDAVMAFEEAGTVFMSDLTIRTKPCFRVSDFQPHRHFHRLPPRSKPTGRGETESLRSYFPNFARVSSSAEKNSKLVDEVRSYFPETWLWEIHSIDSTGEKSIERRLPHTITEWTGGAICVHPETGLGISQDSNITTFQPFFIDFQLPYSVIRGEALPLIVTVFNYLSQCLQIKLSLEPSEEFYLLSEFRFAKICVCAGQSESHKFLIRPGKLGKVNITVHAYSKEHDKEICGNEVTASLNAKDAVTKQLLVEAEGFPKEEVLNYFICLENSNKSYAAEVDLLLPDNVISESSRAYMTVTGDVMGPALNGLENLVKLPTGCGEQNMILFAPNIFVLDYLKSTGKITKDIEDKCRNYMKIGYQRELRYRHKDGSYSAFGNRDKEGSLWLTAFVLRSFSQAKRFITMDEKDLSRSEIWILKMQNEDGCFRPSGMIHHKEMKGGLGESLAPLTAYVLISLLESATELSDQDFVRKGLTCLKSERHPNNYALALFSYAFALAKDFPAAKEYVRQLDRHAVIIGNQKYWNSFSSSKSVSLEISGYYILAQLEMEKFAGVIESLPVVRWLIEQRNSNGGFVSTQDTVVALQALAKYASYQSDSEIDIGLTIQNDDLVHSLNVSEDNKLVTQSVKIPVLPAILDLKAKGSGCALVQFSVRYNVESISANLDFDLNVDINRLEDSDFNSTSLSICMRYNTVNETFNMVLLVVKMLSGFLPDESSLLELQNDPYVQLKRYETKGNDVNLYFDELRNDQKCFNFKMMNEFEVVDVKPSIVRLYDYYQPEKSVFVEYSIGNQHHNFDENSTSDSFSSKLSTTLRNDAEQSDSEESFADSLEFLMNEDET